MTVTDDVLDVTVTVRPHAAPVPPAPAPARPPPAAGPQEPPPKKAIHERILAKLRQGAATAKALARSLGLSYRSSHFRQALADVCRWWGVSRDGGSYARG